MTTEFSGPKVMKVILRTFWSQTGTICFIDHDKNVDNAAVERIVLKCNHTMYLGI